MLISFKNKTVIVTGGSSGIGQAIANQFSELGANVIITGRSLKAPINLSKNTKYLQLDLLKNSSLDNFLEKIKSENKIDVLINNAGINAINELDEININDHNDLLKVNLDGPFLISKSVASSMKSNGGKIINIGSIWSKISKKGRVSYITSKAALAGLTRGLATDLAEFNILVNTVSPGFTITDLTKKSLSKQEIDEISQIIPLKRMASTSEISNIVVLLSSEMNTYITGQNILVDGGYTNV